ncbi:dimethylamine monooxygenase subunit DmmA family protein [Pseudonocardia spirodelae]|uniref:Dimethylamine monooxygenase subunit DmmA family protein n=1 Tax=Pseudonocardia spirodelae TaxID=3133431 RepID=A0ABU8TCR1_9PSEU
MPEPVRPLRRGAVTPPVHVPPEQTTVPRYPGAVAGAAGRAPHLVVVAAPAPVPPLRAGDRCARLAAGADPGALLDRELARLVTGWRILVVGTEARAQEVRAAALARGARDDELVLTPTDLADTARDRIVSCGHCHHRFTARADPGDALGCPGCGLVVHLAAHFSRRLAAWLGAPTPERAR